MIQSSIPITVMPDANKTWVLGDGVESNYTENADWLCCWQRSFTRVTGSSTTLRYLSRHGSRLLEQLTQRLLQQGRLRWVQS